MMKDIELIKKEFNVIDEDEGLDVDDDGREFEYYSISVKGDLKKDFDTLTNKLDELVYKSGKLEYFTDYDFHLDRGFYFGSLAKDGEIEIRFSKAPDDYEDVD